MEEERAPDVNMNDEETSLAEKASENVDLLTENNDATSVGLPSDNHGTVDNQTADDANVNTNVDLLDGNSKDLQLESVDDKDKGPESVADKTDNNASVDVIAKEHSCSVSADKRSSSKSDGSLVDPLNQLQCAAADERPSEIKAANDEKREKLDDASVVDASANELSGSKNDGFGSHVHTLNQPECAVADERSSEIKSKLDEKGEKLVGHISKNDEKGDKLDESFFYASANKLSGIKNDGSHVQASNQLENAAADVRSSETKDEDNERGEKLNNGVADMELTLESEVKETKPEVDVRCEVSKESSNLSFLFEPPVAEGDESGREEEQTAFAKEVENFYKERNLEFKHPKFYKEDLNLLKLWRAVIKLGGYDEVTSCKLWRQVGESFNPPKTCTTVSWTFRNFYEKALLEYEKHRMNHGEHPLHNYSLTEPSRIESQVSGSPAHGSGRALRDAAARAMQGWHSKRLLGSGEVCQPIIKEKNSSCTPKSDKQIKNIGSLKRKKPSTVERTIQVANMKAANPQSDTMVIDIGPSADWVKINVQRTIDCFEVYALVPGLLREEVHVQSDPAGRLVISGQPEQLNNPWGVTSFKKVVSLPSRIDPHQTSAVVTLHGQLFVRVPFEQSDT